MNSLQTLPFLRDADLPKQVVILSVDNVLLLPRGLLPMVFRDVHDIERVEESLKGEGWIGIVQENQMSLGMNVMRMEDSQNLDRQVFDVGCLGHVMSSHYSDEGLFVVLQGVCRFRLPSKVLRNQQMYYPVTFDPYIEDLQEPLHTRLDREYLYHVVSRSVQMSEDTAGIIQELFESPDERLVTTLAMAGPFTSGEKQALLEAPTLPAQCELMTKMMEMNPLNASYTQH